MTTLDDVATIYSVAVEYARACLEGDRREALARTDKDGAAGAGEYRRQAEQHRQCLLTMITVLDAGRY